MAIKTALRMNPSAVFMLSDGEFKERDNRKAGFLAGSATTIDLVRASSTKVPVHAIAFEDRSSVRNMQRVADLTSGSFRCVSGQSDAETRQHLLSDATNAFENGELAAAELITESLLAAESSSEERSRARSLFADILLHRADASDSEASIADLTDAFVKMVEMDVDGVATADKQRQLLDRILLAGEPPSHDQPNILIQLADLVGRHGDADICRELDQRLPRRLWRLV